MNSSESKLAIVIPAYKKDFLRDTLESFAVQTCLDFNLYIGDDNSPYDLYSVVSEFEEKINIIYKKFDTNVGGKNLVDQWNRCLSLIADEEWIWLFSDDDLVDARCVEYFYESLRVSENSTFHFNVKVINEKQELIYDQMPFPSNMLANDFMQLKMKGRICSYVVEYIVNRKIFEEKGGFEAFDLAWGSDDATWMKMISASSLHTIEGANVLWRYSGVNISSGIGDRGFVLRKINASLSYLNWCKQFLADNNLIDKTSTFDKLKWLHEAIKVTGLSIKDKVSLILYCCNKLKAGLFYQLFFILFSLYSLIKIKYFKKLK